VKEPANSSAHPLGIVTNALM